MNMWHWIGGGAAGLVLVGAAIYFFGGAGVLSAIRAATGAIGDAAQSLRQWLKRPGNKTRGLCLVFAVISMGAGLQSWKRGTVIIQQRADYTALKAATDKEKADLQSKMEAELAARDLTIAQFVKAAQKQMELLDLAKRQSAQALAEAEAAKRRAAESEAKYQEAFTNKPPECTAALQVMAKACPSLTGY